MATSMRRVSAQQQHADQEPQKTRASVSPSALLTAHERQHRAKVHNLSSGGAMVELAEPVQTGTRILFTCGSIEVEGLILWQRQQRFGIRFLTPVDEAQVLRQMDRSSAAAGGQL